jgi:hypothetical protein
MRIKMENMPFNKTMSLGEKLDVIKSSNHALAVQIKNSLEAVSISLDDVKEDVLDVFINLANAWDVAPWQNHNIFLKVGKVEANLVEKWRDQNIKSAIESRGINPALGKTYKVDFDKLTICFGKCRVNSLDEAKNEAINLLESLINMSAKRK